MGQTKLKTQLWSFSTAENEAGQKHTPGADVKTERTVTVWQQTTHTKDTKNPRAKTYLMNIEMYFVYVELNVWVK